MRQRSGMTHERATGKAFLLGAVLGLAFFISACAWENGDGFGCRGACEKQVLDCGILPFDVDACTDYCLGLENVDFTCFRDSTCEEIVAGKCAVFSYGEYTCHDACLKQIELCGIPPLDVEACTNYCESLYGVDLWCFRDSTCQEIISGKCSICIPDCSRAECGPDPVCGSSCGTCQGERACRQGRCECNYDECQGVCCKQGERCFQGSCCKPECIGRGCGSDGCGAYCKPGCYDGRCGSNGQCLGGANPGEVCAQGQPGAERCQIGLDCLVKDESSFCSYLCANDSECDVWFGPGSCCLSIGILEGWYCFPVGIGGCD